MSHLHALNGHRRPSHQGRAASPDTVKNPLTPNRAGRVRENDEYAAFARRVLRAYARRVASGDVEALTLMTDLADEIDTAISQAVKACAPSATPGPRSAPGSASPARPPSNAGAAPRDRRDSRPDPEPHPGLGTWGDRRRHRDRLLGRLPRLGTPARHHRHCSTRSGCAAASTPSTWPPANSPPSTTPPPSTGECCTSPAATAARRSARPARPSTSATPASSSARAWPAARASPRPSPRTRACSPPSPPRRSARSTPAGCAARPSCPAAPAATPTPAAARTAATSPARPATSRTTPGSASRCAATATTTTPPCCSTPTRGTCGAGSPPTCPATWPAWLGSPRNELRAQLRDPVRQGGRIPGPRRRPLPRRHPPGRPRRGLPAPARPVHRRPAVRRHRPGRRRRPRPRRRHRQPPVLLGFGARRPTPGPSAATTIAGTGQPLDGQAVANYIAKYATKTLDRPRPARQRASGTRSRSSSLRCSAHYRQMITTAWQLGGKRQTGDPRFRQWAHMLGYGGHFLTKSRRYSVTFGQLRQPAPTTAAASATPTANATPGAAPSMKPSSWSSRPGPTPEPATPPRRARLALASAARAREH